MFYHAYAFNQPIGNWNVSNVSDMAYMFFNDTIFNQPLENWNVSKVTNMSYMFENATAFNQPIRNWDVSKVTNMGSMFENATAFNQPIGNWNVSEVTYMGRMFLNATAFNQPIGNWNVSRVKNMSGMFAGNTNLSINNYDSLLIGWYARIFPENPLRPSVSFSAGNAKYCKGNLPRSFIISTYGWTITDGGMDCSTSVEELESSKVKLYPNPVISELNVIIDYHIIDEPYVIIDGLGRVVLEGKFKEGESTINLMELAKGIYYLKVSDSYSSKFIKE
jgi:surface protein